MYIKFIKHGGLYPVGHFAGLCRFQYGYSCDYRLQDLVSLWLMYIFIL